ncbi:2'-5' RNA ligase-like protein [Leptospira alexanderi serovar Manhao 3 str. L 60]|uniref:2'-5' RNA ligase-like protein n=1 Tax=Leptospira alexanderi serovar Manhao 3 str. L 60 TaxID=1049759 RepID=V6IA08_9LEPT|nr:2'-5' RNA ligase-like protein [Leptospira alexanderi serovar Manhao 3 str. L 60]
MRTFLGISIPEEVKEQLTSICYGLPDVRWVLRENFHITLVFLGDQSNEQVDTLSEFCSQISFPEFDLNLQSVGTFGKKNPLRFFLQLSIFPQNFYNFKKL